MPTADITQLNRRAEDLERLLILRTSPIAVKMLRTVQEIPVGALRPRRDRNQRLAQCQAFALSRREKQTVAMLAEDSWCFAPLIAYGLVDKPPNPEYAFFTDFPHFERGQYVGIVSAPMRSAAFQPDVVIVYCNPAQLRNLLQPFHFGRKTDEIIYNFFPPVCSYEVVTVMQTGKHLVALPDPGEAMRAFPTEEEIIISIPAAKFIETVEGVRRMDEKGSGYRHTPILMQSDFEQPPMYRTLFKQWGLSNQDDNSHR